MGRAVLILAAVLCGAIPFSLMQPAPLDDTQARAVCGTCHALPPPDVLPKAAWPAEFVRMMYIRENRLPPVGRGVPQVDLPPDMQAVLPYFTSRAPERLAAPETWPAPSESPISFTRRSLTMPDMPGTPAVANIRLLDLDGDKKLDVLGADMRRSEEHTSELQSLRHLVCRLL